MVKYTKEELLAKYSALPQELKAAMSSVESADIINNIGKKHNLRVDQAGELASETGFLLLGITKPNDYIKNLEQQMQVDAAKARDIALEVNEKIFSKVKETLKKIHNLTESGAEKPVGKENEKGEKEADAQKTPVSLAEKHSPEKQFSPVPAPSAVSEKSYFEKLAENKNFYKTAADKTKKETFANLTEQKKEKQAGIITPQNESGAQRSPARETKIDLDEKKDGGGAGSAYAQNDPYREPI